jgi:hypothetical protein
MIVEYRTWTSVANVPFSDESIWLPLTRHLERQHSEMGPVATWEGDASTIVLVLADDQPDRAAAAQRAADIIGEALRLTGLADRFPSVFQVEPAGDLVPA